MTQKETIGADRKQGIRSRMENRVDKSRIVFLLQPSGDMHIAVIEFVIIDPISTFVSR